jgi:hypothetical protein
MTWKEREGVKKVLSRLQAQRNNFELEKDLQRPFFTKKELTTKKN